MTERQDKAARDQGEEVRAALYTRVSTDDQADGTSLATQSERCRAYAAAKGWEVAAEYADAGVSGARADRPQLDRLVAACRRREVDAVVVAKLDRFGRSNRHLAAALGELDDLGIAFVSVAESIDSSTPSGRFLRTLLGGAAEFERDMILERTAAGLRARARAGDWPGGPPPFGFTLERCDATGRNRLAIDPDEAAVVRRATSLILDQGHSTWTAAEVLNSLGETPRRAPRWVHNHLRRVLSSPTLGGRWSYGVGPEAILVEVPAILTAERRAALLDALQATSSGPRRPESRRFYLLSRGVLHGLCGAPMHGVWRRDRSSRAYRCANARPEASPRCSDHPVSADMAEAVVWEEVVSLLSEPDRLMRMAGDYLGLREAHTGAEDDQLDVIDRKIASLREAKTERVARALKAGLDEGLLRAVVGELEAEEATLLSHRRRLEGWQEGSLAETDRVTGLRELAATAVERLGSMDDAERRSVLDLLEVRARVTGWQPCRACGARGKTSGGRGGLPCSVCRAMRRVPSFRIEGVVLDGLDLDAGLPSEPAAPGVGIQFSAVCAVGA